MYQIAFKCVKLLSKPSSEELSGTIFTQSPSAVFQLAGPQIRYSARSPTVPHPKPGQGPSPWVSIALSLSPAPHPSPAHANLLLYSGPCSSLTVPHSVFCFGRSYFFCLEYLPGSFMIQFEHHCFWVIAPTSSSKRWNQMQEEGRAGYMSNLQ